MSARRTAAFLLFAVVCGLARSSAYGETLPRALARAYALSPDINQRRAALRAVDENIPAARAGYLPKASAQGSLGASYQYFRGPPPPNTPLTNNPDAANDVGNVLTYGQRYHGAPRSYGSTVNQTLFDGFKTLNNVRQADAQVMAARETLRATENTVLLNAATAYLDVLRDTAIVGLRRANIDVLEEQLRRTKLRREIGEVTGTDVAQAQASLSLGKSDFYAAQAKLTASISNYRQYVGDEPKQLAAANSAEPMLPRSLSAAVAVSQIENPSIAEALHKVDAATRAVKVAEAALYPTAGATAGVTRSLDVSGEPGYKMVTGSVTLQANAPAYQGGSEYAAIRQAKEQVAQARHQVDLQRDQVRAQTVGVLGQLQAAKAQIVSGEAAVAAAQRAFDGIVQEAKLGQRTTFDVLTAQQTVINARVNLETARHDRIVASYSTLAAMGRLTIARIVSNAPLYDPTRHYEQVRTKVIGTHTPDGQ